MLRPYFSTAILRLPVNGNLAMPIEVDFSSVASQDFDINLELMDAGGIGFVQGVFADNGANNDPLTLSFKSPANQGFVLRFPSRVKTWQPLLLPVGAVRFTAASVVAVARKVELFLVNFPVMPIMWNVP